MKPNNYYYKKIAEKVNDTTYDKFYSSMYYMRQILLAYGQSYDRIQSSNKYCKDWYQLATEETPSGHKYNVWYLRRIAKEYDADFDMTSNENQCLQSILANISLSTTVRLVAEPSTQQYLGNIVLTATVLDEEREPVEGATVTFYDGTSSLGTETTGATGLASITVNNLSIGKHTLKAEYDGHTGSTQVTVTLIPTTLSLSASSSELYYGQTITLTGTSNVGSSKTVKLYDGDTYVKDITTGSGGSISTTITDAIVGLHHYNIRYDGDATHTDAVSISVIVNIIAKILTNMTISVPLDLHYKDTFHIGGLLTDEDGNNIDDATVYLYVGNTSVDNTTTDDGVISFDHSPVSTGNHSFKLVYNGDTSHNNCESATVSRVVQKETTVVDTTLPVNGAVIQEAFEVAGTLFEDDGVAMSGKTVYLKKGSTVLDSFTTNSSGVFGKNDVAVTGLDNGVNTISFVYEGDENYATSSKTYNIVYATYDDMELAITDGKTNGILSYADKTSGSGNTEFCTMTAQLLDDNDDPVSISGVSIIFGAYLKSDDSLITGSQQTVVTDNSGQADYEYVSKGLGDIYIQAEVDDGSSLIQTFAIRDTLKYYNTTFSSTQNINLPSNMPTDFKVIWKTTAHTSTTGGGAWIEIGSNSNNLILFGEVSGDSLLGIYVKVNGGYVVTQTGENILVNDEVEHEYTYNNGNHSISANNKTVSASNSQITDRNYGRVFVPNYRKIKDIMIMPL